jgi:hypothetical protein
MRHDKSRTKNVLYSNKHLHQKRKTSKKQRKKERKTPNKQVADVTQETRKARGKNKNPNLVKGKKIKIREEINEMEIRKNKKD